MKYSKIEVKAKELVLVNISDIHLGNINCDKSMLKNVIDYIQKTNCYWLGGGDYGECITNSDPRFNYDSQDPEFKTPQDQFNAIEEMFRPISNKCLGLIDGNHDYNLWKRHNYNFVQQLSRNLGTEYLTMDAYVRLHFNEFRGEKGNFNIYTHHGWSGARTAGARVNRVFDLYAIFPMLDLYIMGHMHALGLIEKKTSLYIDGGMIHDKISHFLYGGSFLRGYTLGPMAYVEEKTYQPTTLGSPVLKIIPVMGKYTVNFKIEYSEVR